MTDGFYRAVLGYFGFGKLKKIHIQDRESDNKQQENIGRIEWGENKERLTDDIIQGYLGANYEGVMYYNFDAGKWKSNVCLECDMPYQDRFEKLMWEFKAVLEREARFSGYELVAVVTMVVKERLFPGVGGRVTRPFFTRGGTGVVGTIVRRDKKTGKLLSVPSNWNGIGVSKLGGFDAIWYGPKWFALAGIENPEFRNALIRNHAYSR